ncbi:hypothetical protein QR680_003569 [Steinernema hermaphroditum]|uniref:HAT C-terminal dimerisation domain-containing protein n=1 Tax=Steinernema hermaphroditum TaxID=289476 RepID=A0AA39LSK5_9BILA|nr:hypothetical protein QR680_003569 [Steinernema hermaphroditum]
MAKLTSDVYKHFEERDGRYYCMAVGCTKSYKKTGSTSNMLFHYRDKHDEDDSGQPFRNWPRLKATVAEEREVYESAVVTFFAAYGVPFHAVNSQEFLHLIASAGGHQKTISRQKLSEEILTREASQCEYEVRSVLEKQNISLCVDEYTKGSNRFLSVTATLVNSTFHHQTVRVAVVSLDVQRATAENLRKVIEDQLRRYKIRGEDLIALTRDGGANMVKLGRLMGLPSVHCFCHVLNLCVNSPLIYKRFKDFAGGKVLKMPNSTRWNSTYEMIQSFCKLHEKLREFASGLENQYSAISVGIYTALSLDMAEINSLCKTLKFLKDICLLAEGRRSCASIIFYLIRRIEDHCAKQSQSQSTTPLCQDVNDTILRTLQKHKSEYLKSDMLLICTYLDPRFVDHPNILERTDWMRARQLLADMCEQRFNSSNSLPSAANFDGPVVIDDGEDDWNSWNRCSHDIQNSARSPVSKEIEAYSNDARAEQLPMPDPQNNELSTTSMLAFWRRRKSRLPQLHALAQQHLSVCCSSAEPERVFSSLTHLLSNSQRSSLTEDNIERLMTVRQRLACRKFDQPLLEASSDDEDVLGAVDEEENLTVEQEAGA